MVRFWSIGAMGKGIIIGARRLVASEWPILALLALFGILYSLTALNSYGMFLWDESEYASIGRSVLRGQGFAIAGVPNALRPPILPLAGAAGLWLFGGQSDDLVLRGTACGFALLALLCVYGFATAGFDRATGLVAAGLLGVMPWFWTFVSLFMCEIAFLTFFAGAVWCFYFGTYLHERFFVWSWICWGLAFLTRYTASLFLPVVVLFAGMALWRGGPEARRRLASRTFFLSPLAALPLVLPWLIREYVTFGNALAGVRKASRQLQDYLPGVSMPWNFYLGRTLAMLSLAISVLVVAGVVWAVWKRERLALHNALAAALILGWFSCYRYKEDRMISSALPFLAVIAAVFLTKATARIRPAARGFVRCSVLAAIVVLSLRVARPVLEHRLTMGYPVFLEAMGFLRENASPGATVLGANSPQIHWYSDLRAINIPEESELPEALRRSEWTVITNFEPVQKAYVLGLIKLIDVLSVTRECAVFQDRDYITVVIRSDKLLRAVVGKQE